jgi:hypothetical protein
MFARARAGTRVRIASSKVGSRRAFGLTPLLDASVIGDDRVVEYVRHSQQSLRPSRALSR